MHFSTQLLGFGTETMQCRLISATVQARVINTPAYYTKHTIIQNMRLKNKKAVLSQA